MTKAGTLQFLDIPAYYHAFSIVTIIFCIFILKASGTYHSGWSESKYFLLYIILLGILANISSVLLLNFRKNQHSSSLYAKGFRTVLSESLLLTRLSFSNPIPFAFLGQDITLGWDIPKRPHLLFGHLFFVAYK